MKRTSAASAFRSAASISRTVLLPALLAVTVFVAGCAGGSALRGSWVVENYAGEVPDPAAPPAVPEPGRSVKILTADRFAFGYERDGKQFFGGGTWSFRDGVYREHIEYHWLPQFRGRTVEFDCRLVGPDLWVHRSLPGESGERWGIHEVWRRIARPEPVDPWSIGE